MRRVKAGAIRGATAWAAVTATAVWLALPASTDEGDAVLRVPQDVATVQEAVDLAEPGTTILLDAGVYPGDVVVPPDKHDLTIRGVDRNRVVFDGENLRNNAIEIEADGVRVENMSAHDFVGNGFYWDGVDGYAGRYLTVWNVGLYGIYAIESRHGTFERSLVSGAADAAFYIGECHPCDALLTDLIAQRSAVGYSGTNAGGNLVLRDSRFELNGAGILPNSYEVGLEPPPQRDTVFADNVVIGSGTVRTPVNTPLGGFAGVGIGIAGGVDNVVEGNRVEGSSRYGIVVVPTVQREAVWVPQGNEVRGNTVSGSGLADLALSAGSGPGNCFEGNEFSGSEPDGLEVSGCTPATEVPGSEDVAAHLALPPPELFERMPELLDAPDYATMPPPPSQPTMPGIRAAPAEEETGETAAEPAPPGSEAGAALAVLLAGMAAGVGAAGLLLVVLSASAARRGGVVRGGRHPRRLLLAVGVLFVLGVAGTVAAALSLAS